MFTAGLFVAPVTVIWFGLALLVFRCRLPEKFSVWLAAVPRVTVRVAAALL
jgi:hypothetical protein